MVVILICVLITITLPQLFIETVDESEFQVTVLEPQEPEQIQIDKELVRVLSDVYGETFYQGFAIKDYQILFINPLTQEATLYNSECLGNEYHEVSFNDIEETLLTVNDHMFEVNGFETVIVNIAFEENILERIIMTIYQNNYSKSEGIPHIDEYFVSIDDNLEDRVYRNRMIVEFKEYLETNDTAHLSYYNDIWLQWQENSGNMYVNELLDFDEYEGGAYYVERQIHAYVNNLKIEDVLTVDMTENFVNKLDEYKYLGMFKAYLSDKEIEHLVAKTAPEHTALENEIKDYYNELAALSEEISNANLQPIEIESIYTKTSIKLASGTYVLYDNQVITGENLNNYDILVLKVSTNKLEYYTL